jgi:iron(II)-dependent oxidoreductase
VHRAGGRPLLRPDLLEVYDAFETPRADRGEDLAYLRRQDALDYEQTVRGRALDVLAELDPGSDDPLLKDGFVVELVANHELQHQETMLQALQLAERGAYHAPPLLRPPLAVGTGPPVVVEAGTIEVGAGEDGFAYDNERPRHSVDVGTFRIDPYPVTCAAWRAFMAGGGYARREWWSPEGWAWREAEGAERPLSWRPDGTARWFDRLEVPADDSPVMHVSYWEAEAFARSRGARLPTEAEWEAARAAGALRAVGEVWEWTSSYFGGYPGFRSFPYREYSEVFFGEGYRVLRGGSWATDPSVARPTFRNWDLPQRRQIFCGVRLSYAR